MLRRSFGSTLSITAGKRFAGAAAAAPAATTTSIPPQQPFATTTTAQSSTRSTTATNTASVVKKDDATAATTATTRKDYAYYKSKLNNGIGRSHNIFMEKAEGSYMYDTTGRKYLDFACGIGVTNLGHNHPRLVKAVQQQSEQLWHGMIAHGIHAPMADLIDEMDTISPFPTKLDNYFFCNSGAEAVEGAVRAARTVTKRQNIMVMQGSFHGRTNACLALTTSKYAYGIGCRPLMPGVNVAPPPYTTQLKVDPTASVESMTKQCLGIMEDLLSQTQHPSEVAMILVEPVLGEGGYLPLPAAYLKGLRQLCDKHGILLVFDEVQSGFGRTGTMWACEQSGVCPDILLFAKGVANGLPLAGFITSKALGDQCPAGTQGGTYAGNAVACASAAEVIRVFRDEAILPNVIARGQQLFAAMEAMIKRNNFPIQEVRGRGLMIGFQFVDDAVLDGGSAGGGGDATPSSTTTPSLQGISGLVVNEALQRGLMLLNTSKFETIRLIPALNVTAEQCDEAMAILEESIKAALVSKGIPPSSTSTLQAKGFRSCCEGKTRCECSTLEGWDVPCRRITRF